jgi:hypothetical protein
MYRYGFEVSRLALFDVYAWNLYGTCTYVFGINQTQAGRLLFPDYMHTRIDTVFEESMPSSFIHKSLMCIHGIYTARIRMFPGANNTNKNSSAAVQYGPYFQRERYGAYSYAIRTRVRCSVAMALALPPSRLPSLQHKDQKKLWRPRLFGNSLSLSLCFFLSFSVFFSRKGRGYAVWCLIFRL